MKNLRTKDDSMEVKFEICMRIGKDAFPRLKKLEHHAEYLLDLENWPEIESVYGCKVQEIR